MENKQLSMEDLNKLSYEDAMARLNKVLNDLENEDLPLEESLELFKCGINLYNHCDEILTKTEGEIKILLDKESNKEENFIKGDE